MLLADDWNLQESLKRFQNNTLDAVQFSSMSKHAKNRSFRDGEKSVIQEDSSLSREGDSSKKLEDTPKTTQFKTSTKVMPTSLEAIGEKPKGKTTIRKNDANFDKSIKAEGQSIAPTVPVTAF